jgi:hypothetical protein
MEEFVSNIFRSIRAQDTTNGMTIKDASGNTAATVKDATNAMGILYMIPEASRPNAWVLNGGTQTAFTDVDFSSYAPAGAKALLLKWQLYGTSSGASAQDSFYVRKNGSSETDTDRLVGGTFIGYISNGATHQPFGACIVECDTGRIIEYLISTAGTSVALYLNITGYIM